MLYKLKINNFILIDNADIFFHSGMTSIVGESGTGKSLLLETINFLKGDKYSNYFFKDTSNRILVEATILENNINNKLLNKYNINKIKNYVILKREILKNRNYYYINGKKVRSNIFKEFFYINFDVHEQHQNILLKDKENYILILDNYGNYEKTLNLYKKIYTEYTEIINKLQSLDILKEDLNNLDLYKEQLLELEDLNIKENEIEDLNTKYKQLKEQKKYIDDFVKIKYIFENKNILENIYEIKALCVNGIEQEYENIANNSYFEMKELYNYIISFLENTYNINEDINKIENRISRIYDLQNKYGKDLFIEKENIKNKIKLLENFEYDLLTLEKEKDIILEKLNIISNKLTNERKNTAKEFEKKIIDQLKLFNMTNVDFKVKFIEKSYNLNGKDEIDFYLRTNIGMNLKPLKEIASGGELSRINLTLKMLMTNIFPLKTFIFDEIDTGVSGKISSLISKEIKKLSRNTQIFIISHNAQVVSASDNVLKVIKNIKNNKTFLEFKYLDNDEHISEVAEFISIDEITELNKQNAIFLINKFKNI